MKTALALIMMLSAVPAFAEPNPEQDWKDNQAFFLYMPCQNGCTPVGRVMRAACRIAMDRTGDFGKLSCGQQWGSNALFTVNGGKMQYSRNGGPGTTWVGLDFKRIFSPEKLEQIRAQCEPDLPCAGHATFKLVEPVDGKFGPQPRVVLLDFD